LIVVVSPCREVIITVGLLRFMVVHPKTKLARIAKGRWRIVWVVKLSIYFVEEENS
ncbi:unnamed protein product, partial [Musa acuminata var. zebrina]